MPYQTATERLSQILTCARYDLPRVNVACRDGDLVLNDWTPLLRPMVDGADSLTGAPPAEGKLLLLQYLEQHEFFFISAVRTQVALRALVNR